MSAPKLLVNFVEEELQRAGALIGQVLQAMLDRPLPAGSGDRNARDRQLDHEVVKTLPMHRPLLTQRFSESLREQVKFELDRRAGVPVGAPGVRAPALKLTLSLLDEDEVAADVELARVIEAINSVAEYELRELGTFAAALVGDESASHTSNPLNAETYARSLWAAARALPLSRAHQASFMRMAGPALAHSVRMACAAACTRLEARGVQPSVYRTIVRPGGAHVLRPDEHEDTAARTDLHELLDSMPVPLDPPPAQAPPLEEVLLRADEMLSLLPEDAGLRTRMQAMDAQHRRLLGSANRRVDQQLIELLSRLFDAILADPLVPPPIQVLLSRLHASALRVALREPDTLDSYSHPVWLFMDRLAFQAETHGGGRSPAMAGVLRHAQGLIDHVAREPVQDAALYRWGLERLRAYERHRLERRVALAEGQIDTLQRFGSADRPPSPSRPAPQTTLDIGTMDTIPAEMMASPPTALDASASWLPQVPVGEWLQVFLQGRWQTVQVLWRSQSSDIWLLCDGGDDALTWAVRQRAMERLAGEQLIAPLAPHSLVQRAADQVLRQMVTPHEPA
jgi:hypothetical protein